MVDCFVDHRVVVGLILTLDARYEFHGLVSNDFDLVTHGIVGSIPTKTWFTIVYGDE